MIPTRVSSSTMTRTRNRTSSQNLSTAKVQSFPPAIRKRAGGSVPPKPKFAFPFPFPHPIDLGGAFHLFRNLVRSSPPANLLSVLRANRLAFHKGDVRFRGMERVGLRHH